MSQAQGGSEQPLLAAADLESAWRQSPTHARECVTTECDVEHLFEEHSNDAIRFLQTNGLEKITEFTEHDEVVFAAFKNMPLVTFGSDLRHIDAEREWRTYLRHASKSSRKRSRKGWSNEITVEAFVVSIRDAAAPHSKGLLFPLIEQMQSSRCTYAIFSLPAVQSVVRFKWETYARRLVLIQLAVYTVWLIAHYIFLTAFQGEDLTLSLSQLTREARGRVTLAGEAVALIAMLPFLALDAGTVWAMGWPVLHTPAVRLDVATVALQLFIATLHLGRFWVASRWLTYAIAIQAILLMARFQNIAQSLRRARFSFSAIVREVISDVLWALIFLIMTCIAFGSAMHIAFRRDEKPPEEFSTFFRSVLAMFEHVYGDLELKEPLQSSDPVFATALALAFIVISGFVLSNLLIGVVIEALDRALANESAKNTMLQAVVTTRMEGMLPSWLQRRYEAHWYPKYVHVLRINPRKLDAVDVDALWALHGNDEAIIGKAELHAEQQEELEGSGEEQEEEEGRKTGAESKEISRQLQKLRGQLSRQEDLLRQLLEQKQQTKEY